MVMTVMVIIAAVDADNDDYGDDGEVIMMVC